MKVGRRIGLLMAMALGLSGCRAAGTGSLSLHPRPTPSRKSLDLQEFVAEHNRNAERIESLEARPRITVAMARHAPFPVDGRMALERPRNFKLELSHPVSGTTKADIGSNDEEFWFWVSSQEDKSVYWCNYSDLPSSALAVTYQPDWIIEALGLKPISSAEAAQIQVEEGPGPDTTALIFPTSRKQGETSTRVMIVSNHDRRIKEYRVLTADRKVLIAQAEPSRYKQFAATTGDSAGRETCFLPQTVRFDWKRDQLVLDVVLQEVKLNQFDPSQSAALFTEPKIDGYQRRNLAELSRRARQDQRTTIRQTMPQPEPRNGVKFGRPAPLSDDGAIVPKLGRASIRAGTTPPPVVSPLEELVGAPSPPPPVSRPSQEAVSALAKGDALSFQR